MMSEAWERMIENGAACPECGKGRILSSMITPIWRQTGFSEVRYCCTECQTVIVLRKDDRFI
jgi:hypothetical protein